MDAFSRLLFLAFLSALPLASQTMIGGEIGGMTFGADGSPYIVEKDLVIPSGKTATIRQGCVFLFKPFTGIIVRGNFSVEGTPLSPVIFSSENDATYNTDASQVPNPFDWNGILIDESAGEVRMRAFQVMYSVYGIKSRKEDIVLQNAVFRQNGQFHFTVDDKIEFVQENITYSYGTPADGGESDSATAGKSRKKERKIDKKKLKTGVSIGMLAAGLGAAGAGVYYLLDANENYERSANPDAGARATEYYADYEQSHTYSIASFVGAGVLVPAAAVVYLVKVRAIDSSVTVSLGVDWVGGTKGVWLACAF